MTGSGDHTVMLGGGGNDTLIGGALWGDQQDGGRREQKGADEIVGAFLLPRVAAVVFVSLFLLRCCFFLCFLFFLPGPRPRRPPGNDPAHPQRATHCP